MPYACVPTCLASFSLGNTYGRYVKMEVQARVVIFYCSSFEFLKSADGNAR